MLASLLQLLIISSLLFSSSSAVEFLFNGFDSSNITLYSDATVRSGVLSLTNDSTSSSGRAVYRTKIPTKSSNYPYSPLPFSTSFIFSISPVEGYEPGHGFAFLFTPTLDTNSFTYSQHLALFNGTHNGDPRNHVLAVEFDVFQNPEFSDINDNHVGIDINSLTSVAANTSGFVDSSSGAFVELPLNNGENYQVWIDYNDSQLSVAMAPVGRKKPDQALISINQNLSDVLLDEMYVGFAAATGALVESHRILAWSFSNSNFSAYEVLITSNLPSFASENDSVFSSRKFVAGISSAAALASFGVMGFVFYVRRARRRKENDAGAREAWEWEYWPHRIYYSDIFDATKGFSDSNVIGVGGNGKVYKGILRGQVEVAVKCIRQETGDGMKEFLAEVSTLGRLKHRNLVGLRGWCKTATGDLMLVYDFMENGSLDKRIFYSGNDASFMLGWEARVRILKDVAAGILYLHEGWEVRVVHRDIKASNVLLDGEMHGRLGDFGLARAHSHARASMTTRVVGTVGYMAPEVIRGGKVSDKTDVFGFGVLVLEVVCGRRPVEVGCEPLVVRVWGFMERGELGRALDARVRKLGGFDEREVEMLLHVGLMCTCKEPHERPSMRRVVSMMEGADAHEPEGRISTEAYLLGKLQSLSSWTNHVRHPSYRELQPSSSSTVSLYGSDLSLAGR
ncbi:hypothetical protein ACLOJK_010759 [Asimina triloba]